jgi:hypothetical protein
MGTPVNQRVQKRREALRAQGLRPVQIWVPDTRDPKFRKALEEQGRRAAEADARDTDLQEFVDAVLQEAFGELDEAEAKYEAKHK